MSLGRVGVPSHLELVATVAEVARYSRGVSQLLGACHLGLDGGESLVVLVGLQRSDGAVLAVAEDHEFDAVEAEQLLSELTCGVGDSVVFVTAELLQLILVGQGGSQTVHVKRPSVDVRIYAEISSGTKEEGLTLLVAGTSLDERLADLVHLGLREALGVFEELFLGRLELVVELRGLSSEVFVSQVDRVIHILLGDLTHLFLLLSKLFLDRIIVFLA